MLCSSPRPGARRFVALLALALASACDCGGERSIDFDGGGGSEMGPRADGGTTDGAPAADLGTEDAAIPTLDGGRPIECADEVCGDGLDGDCDGAVDEGCSCTPGDTAACFRGGAATRGVGACMDGTMVCEGSFEFGAWGPCMGDVLPAEELCDEGGIDESCDGSPNEGCECSTGDPDIACGTDTGACVAGVSRCVSGERTSCEGAVGPTAETCDGTDQDCDGAIDEGLSRGCGASATGVCRLGTETCTDGAWGSCEGAVDPRPEACDGLDDDCDGNVDEALSRSCGTSDVGACMLGTQSCSAGLWGTCGGSVGPATESCDGTDEDCDGMVDESLVRACGSDIGVCAMGTQTCSAGTWSTSCAGEVAPGGEVCEGSLDEDCDDAIDEGCGCTNGATRPCGSDEGACSRGTQTCSGGGWGACMGAVGPTMELCEGVVDEDCDGAVDEGCQCTIGASRSCGTTSVGECRLGTESCESPGVWGTCGGAIDPDTEVCNGLDDDCDGAVDEMDVCPRFPPTVMCPGDQAGLVGDPITVGGTGSDPDGGSVTLSWSVVTAPAGSSATPSPTSGGSTTFTPDATGSYTLRLCATDDEGETRCCTFGVTATSTCTPPSPPTITACGTSWDRRPVVEVTPLPSGVTYDLLADGAVYGSVTMVGQNYHRPASGIAVGGPPPGDAVQIVARACLSSDPTCCATSAPATVRLIEACTTPVAPTSSNIVFSEYVTNGDGMCSGPDCEAGEAIEITNLSHCPVTLDGTHFGYCNPNSCGAFRWMDFGPTDIVPPRGVYVAIRNLTASMCTYPFFGPDDPGLFGLRVSDLEMQGSNLASGWFNNGGGGMSVLRLATGAFVDISSGTTLEQISPYSGSAGECSSIGFDAIDECGNISAVAEPTDVLTPNQLGRLWEPCDAVVAPVPAACN